MTKLDPEMTTAGALERVLLAETAAPSAADYDADESLKACGICAKSLRTD